ncbi:hypothetical protein ACFL0A_01420 [Patescibacteria group bacterium]
MKEKIKKIFFKIFGYIGIVDCLIGVYIKLKKAMLETSEDEILNKLILTRIKAPPRVASKEEERAHYKPLLNNSNKTLEDVISEIVNYELWDSRADYLKRKFSSKFAVETDIAKAKTEAKRYIKESVNKINL